MMADAILKLEENRVRRMYRGGAGNEKLHGRKPVDSDCPEEWIGSVVDARNSEMSPVEKEGISRVSRNDSHPYLNEVLMEDPEYYLGNEHYQALGIQTGVLVKFLDSAMRLALQAHPDRSYAEKYLNSRWGKMECYYLLDVREDVEPYIYLGFQHAPSKAAWKAMIEEQDLDGIQQCFEKIKVKKGDFWYIPAGMVHAIGEGITMIEIMEPSDWVIRCEFERQKGKRFPYHARYMGKSLDEVIDLFDFHEYTSDVIRAMACLTPELITDQKDLKRQLLISEEKTDCFRVEIIEVWQSKRIEKAKRLAILMVLDGFGKLSCKQIQMDIKTGDSFFLAAAEDSFDITVSSETSVQLCMVMPKAYDAQDNET
ncbi:mannose-6-phosphate isomerase [Lachnospiraceae bacterium ASD3451]|uniref:class I mannose-6-phosphate isomerase n=1 Tax=Diplocloster agilis TaxID=2850323 RepID=UPI001DA4F4D5|nr:class I mannose-6-phosphate isomerase [Diplocloster agilis]MBU9746426.1 mannose-6-phosphate isomerase [Diplocloster agilis]